MKGTVQLDFVIALVFFFFGISLAYIYASNSMRGVQTNLQEITTSVISEAYDQLMDKAGFDVRPYLIKFSVRYCTKSYPCMLNLTTTDNTSVVDEYNTPLIFDFDGNIMRLLANPCRKTTLFVFPSDTYSIAGDAWINGTALGTSEIVAEYNSTHLLQIYRNTTPLIDSPASLSTSLIGKRMLRNTEAIVVYDNANLSVDSNSTRIWIKFKQQRSINFTLPMYDYCYINSTEYSCSSLTTISTHSNLTSFYNSTIGISFITKNVNVTLNRTGSKLLLQLINITVLEVFVNRGRAELELSRNESGMMFSVCYAGMPATFKAVSSEKLRNTESLDITSRVSYRVEIDNFSYGDEVPLTRNVYRAEMPVTMMEDGMVNLTELVVWVWQ